MSLLSAPEAHARKAYGWVQVDVRTWSQFRHNHAAGAVNIPFVLPDGQTPDPHFLNRIQRRFTTTDKLILSCHSGRSSSRAVVRLSAAGFNNLAHLYGGHCEWLKYHYLPTSGNEETDNNNDDNNNNS